MTDPQQLLLLVAGLGLALLGAVLVRALVSSMRRRLGRQHVRRQIERQQSDARRRLGLDEEGAAEIPIRRHRLRRRA